MERNILHMIKEKTGMLLHNVIHTLKICGDPFMESDLALSQSVPRNEAGPRRRCGQGNCACASDAGRVAMDFSPWMSAKFPPNAGLQESRKQCKTTKVTNHEHVSAPSFVFKLLPWSFCKASRRKQFGCVKRVRTARGMQSNKAVAFSSTVVTVITVRELIVWSLLRPWC